MNASQVYREAVSIPSNSDTDSQQVADDSEAAQRKDAQDRIEVEFLNWKIHPATKILHNQINERIALLHTANGNFAMNDFAKNTEKVFRNLVEIQTLKDILAYGPTKK